MLRCVSTLNTRIQLYFIFSLVSITVACSTVSARPFTLTEMATPNFVRVDREGDLPTQYILSLAEDTQGLVWIGTDTGLYRYDGYRFTHFSSRSNQGISLSGNIIMKILPMPDNDLLVGTMDGGLTWIHQREQTVSHFTTNDQSDSAISGDTVRAIEAFDERYVYVGTNNDLDIFDLQHRHFFRPEWRIFCPGLSQEASIRDLLKKDNYLIVSTNRGVCRLVISPEAPDKIISGTLVALTPGYNGYRVNVIDDRLWIGLLNQGVMVFDLETLALVETYKNAEMNSSSLITAIRPVSDTTIWLVYDNGVTRIDRQSLDVINTLTSSPENNLPAFNFVLQSQSGMVWLGTQGEGLFKFNPDAPLKYLFHSNHYHPYKHKLTWQVTQAPDGHIWTTNESFMLSINRQTFEVTDVTEQHPQLKPVALQKITEIHTDQTQHIWIATREGLVYRYHEPTRTLQAIHLPTAESRNLIYTFYDDNLGNIWIGTDKGLFSVDSQTNKVRGIDHIKHSDLLKEQYVNHLAMDKNNTLWIGSFTGLFSLKNNELHDHRSTIQSKTVWSVTPDMDGKVWINTSKNIYYTSSDSHSIEKLDYVDGLSSEIIQGIVPSATQKTLWHINGLIDLNNNRVHNLQLNRDANKQRLSNYEGKRLNDGTILFGNDHGVIIVDEHTPSPAVENPPTIVTGINVDNQAFSPLVDTLYVPRDSKSVTVDFSTLDYTNPTTNLYQYRLNHLQNHWKTIPAGQSSISFHNLNPGQYLLEVMGSNHQHIWSNQKAQLPIVVLPSWYETWWSRTLAVVIFGIIAFRLDKLRIRHLRRKQRELNQMVKTRTDDISKLGVIGQQINSSLNLHDVLTVIEKNVKQLLKTDEFLLCMLNKNKQVLEMWANVNHDSNFDYTEISLADEHRLAVCCVNNNHTIFTNNTQEDLDVEGYHLSPILGEPTLSVIYLPLIASDKVIGCISVQSYSAYAYTENDLQILKTISSYAAIALSNADSHSQLARTHEELKQAQEQLVNQEKMAGLGTLTAGVAHEINNPTNFTHSAVYLMRDEIDHIKEFLHELAGGKEADTNVLSAIDQQFEKLLELADTAQQGTIRIKKIVADLRSFSRTDVMQLQTIDITDITQSTIRLVKIKFKDINFETIFTGSTTISVYPNKIAQVLMNLLVNSCHAIREKQHVKKAFTGTVNISTWHSDEQLVIELTDNGIGMNESTRKKIYDPFFTTKDVGTGTGLGMSISFKIIEEHQGKMYVSSTPGEGTVITITLPVNPVKSPQPDSSAAPEKELDPS